MSLIEIHTRLSTTATLFMAALALWALGLRIRTKPLDGNWLPSSHYRQPMVILTAWKMKM